MKILVVEDDPEAGRYLARALNESGHVADLASDGEAGLEMALAGSYDVLVVDRMLPRRDGLSLIMALRAEKRTVPVLILSALGQVDDRVLGLRAAMITSRNPMLSRNASRVSRLWRAARTRKARS
jgi:two-component system, OmpR family, response regulator